MTKKELEKLELELIKKHMEFISKIVNSAKESHADAYVEIIRSKTNSFNKE